MNTFSDLEHALLTGVVVATLRNKGIEVEVLLNDVEDTTPYLQLKFDDTTAMIVVLPRT